MPARSLALALAAASVVAAARADARGETSLQPQRTVVPAAAPALVARAPRWSRPIAFADPLYARSPRVGAVPFRPEVGFPRDPPVLVAGGGLVFAAAGARTCAFDDRSGRVAWCANGAAWRLALGHGEVVAVAHGSATAYEATSGRRRWSVPADGVTPSPHGFVFSRGESVCGELTPGGSLLWRAVVPARLDAEPVALGPRTMLQHGFVEGARFGDPLFLVTSGAGGGVRPLPVEATSLLAVRGATIATAGGWRAEEVEDRALTLDVDLTDVQTAKPLQSWHYEPDYDANLRAYGEPRSLLAGRVQSKWAAVEGDALYATVLDRLYRYRLGPAAGQHPLLVAAGGRWIGGPYAGALLIDRPDGLWTVRADEARTREILAVPHGAQVEVAALALSDGYAYAALTDGTVAGFALRDGRRAIAARVACTSYRGVAVGSTSVLLVCTSRAAPTVYAFPRLRAAP